MSKEATAHDSQCEEESRKRVMAAAGQNSDSGVFSLNKPRDAADGFGKGAGNIAGGLLGGVAFLMAAPVKGAIDGQKESGSSGAAKGFAKGLGMGIVGGTVMAVGGVGTGVVQIGRGVYHTPGAVKAMSEGKDWDDDTKSWVYYSLPNEAERVLSVSIEDLVAVLRKEEAEQVDPNEHTTSRSTHVNSEKNSEVPVSDSEYYDVLGVSTAASTGDIKRAYYKRAKESHPDRHPGDFEAHSRFQKIGEAYQCLSDERLRQQYDARGKDGLEGAPRMDSGTLFAMIFGSEKFDALVGELQLAAELAAEAEEDIYRHPRVRAFKQKRREVTLAQHLADLLQPYLDSGCNEVFFRQTVKAHAMELSVSPFGSLLLQTIGDAYAEHARAELDALDSLLVAVKQAGRNAAAKFEILRAGVQAAMAASALNKLQKKLDSGSSTSSSTTTSASPSSTTGSQHGAGINANSADVAMKHRLQALGGHMFTVMWAVSQLDIRATLARVSRRVTRDCSVDEASRNRRKTALKILGEELCAAGRAAGGSVEQVMAAMLEQSLGHGDARKDGDAPMGEEAPRVQMREVSQEDIKGKKVVSAVAPSNEGRHRNHENTNDGIVAHERSSDLD